MWFYLHVHKVGQEKFKLFYLLLAMQPASPLLPLNPVSQLHCSGLPVQSVLGVESQSALVAQESKTAEIDQY